MSEEDLSKYMAFPKTKKEKKSRKPMRRVKKGSRSAIRKELDKLWSQAVKVIAGFKCEYCNSESSLNSHHIYSRSVIPLRWDVLNGVCLCSGHHTLSSTFSAHKTPMEFSYWYYEKHNGQTLDDHLIPIKRANKPFSMEELQELKKKLENIISARTK